MITSPLFLSPKLLPFPLLWNFQLFVGKNCCIPFLFVLSILLFILEIIIINNNFINCLFYLEFVLYSLLNIYFSSKLSLNSKIKYFPVLLFLFLFIHLSYGCGSFMGLVTLIKYIN